MKSIKEFQESIRMQFQKGDMIPERPASFFSGDDDYDGGGYVVARVTLSHDTRDLYEQDWKVNDYDKSNVYYESYDFASESYIDYGNKLPEMLKVKYHLLMGMKEEMRAEKTTGELHPNITEKEREVALAHLKNIGYAGLSFVPYGSVTLSVEEIEAVIQEVYSEEELDMVLGFSELNIAETFDDMVYVGMLYYTQDESVKELVNHLFATLQKRLQAQAVGL